MRIIFSVVAALLMLQACSPKKEDAKTSAPEQAATYAPHAVTTKTPPKQGAVPSQAAGIKVAPPVNVIDEPVLTEASFTCVDGAKFVARFKRNKVDVVFDKYPPITLFQRVTASGFNYQNPQYQLQGKGKTASWTAGRRVPVACTSK
jgi:membrane-bound inhibitor of C-type lysozyme